MKFTPVLITLLFLLVQKQAQANPSPDPMTSFWEASFWIKTLFINYPVDLIALVLGLWITGSQQYIPFRYAPLLNIPVVIAGYLADYTAAELTLKDGIGRVMASSFDSPLLDPALAYHRIPLDWYEATKYLGVSSLILFFTSWAIIRVILKVYETPYSGKELSGAAAMALISAPYIPTAGWSFATGLVSAAVCVGLAYFAVSAARATIDKARFRQRR